MKKLIRRVVPTSLQMRQSATNYKYTVASTDLLQEKDTTSGVLAVIPANSPVQVLDSAEDWYNIIYNYQTGYVPTSSLSITEYTWRNTPLRSYADAQSNAVATIPAKSQVQVLSVTGNWSYVVYDNNQKGYIFNEFLTDDGNPPNAYDFQYFTTDMTRFVNSNNILSPTNNLITTDLENKLTYIFQRANNAWNLLYTWDCTVGAPNTPTIRGTFYINGRKPYFGSESYRVKYATRILESYYYHSILFNSSGTEIKDDRLGLALSHGCIRLAPDNAQWIYDNILDATAVIIN